MKYADKEGTLFESDNKTDLVLELYRSGWGKSSARGEDVSYHELFQFCLDCTDRIGKLYGIHLVWFTTTDFIGELITAKLIMEID